MPFKVGDQVHMHMPWGRPIETDVMRVIIEEDDYAVIITEDPQDWKCGVYDSTPCVHDVAQNRETTENMVVGDGLIAVAVDPSNQETCNHWRELYVDCWGVKEDK